MNGKRIVGLMLTACAMATLAEPGPELPTGFSVRLSGVQLLLPPLPSEELVPRVDDYGLKLTLNVSTTRFHILALRLDDKKEVVFRDDKGADYSKHYDLTDAIASDGRRNGDAIRTAARD